MVGSLAGLVQRVVPDRVREMPALLPGLAQALAAPQAMTNLRELVTQEPLAERLMQAEPVRSPSSKHWGRAARGPQVMAGLLARPARVMMARARRPSRRP